MGREPSPRPRRSPPPRSLGDAVALRERDGDLGGETGVLADDDAAPPHSPASPTRGPGAPSTSAPSTAPQHAAPAWVTFLNASLASDPAWVLLAFVLVDMGSALALYALFTALAVPVDADFALAYALSKSIRAPRLALDACVASWMARTWPALAEVRVGPIVDEAVELIRRAKRRAKRLAASNAFGGRRTDAARHRRDAPVPRTRDDASTGGTAGEATAARRKTKLCRRDATDDAGGRNQNRWAREARELTDRYGLAYMAAKNAIGPVSIAAFYLALRGGADVAGWIDAAFACFGAAPPTAVNGAGRAAGTLALASWTSTALFPAVVLGAGALGPKLGEAARRIGKGVERLGEGGGGRLGRGMTTRSRR